MNCRVPECPNHADPYSKTGLCESHQKKFVRYQQVALFGRVWSLVQGFILVLSLILVIAGRSSPFTTYFFIAYQTIMFLGGLLVFVHYYLKSTDVRL